MPYVMIAGTRDLAPTYAASVAAVCRLLLADGRSICTGCARGADEFARPFAAYVLVARLSPLWRSSPSRALAARTRSCVDFAARSGPGAGLVAFFGRSGRFPGTLLACRSAVAAGLPVVAFCCGLAPRSLPSLGRGLWLPAARSGPFAGSFRWSPSA